MNLPAFKFDSENGYKFCPKCAIMWGLLLLAIGGAVYFVVKKGRTENGR